ncbi:Phospholipase A2-alpha [Bienertia sinuspersici]
MSFKLPDQITWLPFQKNNPMEQTRSSQVMATESPKKGPLFEVNFFGWPLLSILPWAVNLKEKIQMPTTILNKELTRQARSQASDTSTSTQPPRVRFRPYVSKVPWHTGARAFLSQIFPRYGHYCGPNWSSGKDGGSLVWDKRPIDWLDYCCYCHDIGYDTHEQEKLLEADLAFLECLEKTHTYSQTKGDKHVAHFYRTMCVQGLRNILIPYRTHLVKLQSGPPLLQFGWLSNMAWKGWSWRTIMKIE